MRGSLVVLVPIAEHKSYALDSLLEAITRLTLPHDHCFLFHVNRSSASFAEDLRLRLMRRDVPHVLVFSDKDYSDAAVLLRERNGEVHQDSGAVASLMAIVDARSALLRGALLMNPDRLFWLDSDMIPPRDTIPRLMAHEKEVVSAKCMMRRAEKPTVCAWRYDRSLLFSLQNVGRSPVELRPEDFSQQPGVAWLHGKTDWLQFTQRFLPESETGLQEVDGVGLASTLWSSEAAKKVDFHLQNLTSDDMLASSLLQEAGFQIFVDMDLHVPHLDASGESV